MLKYAEVFINNWLRTRYNVLLLKRQTDRQTDRQRGKRDGEKEDGNGDDDDAKLSKYVK